MERSEVRKAKEMIRAFDWASVEKAFGIKIELGNGSFDPSSDGGFSFRVTATTASAAAKKVDNPKLDFDTLCRFYGLTPEDYGRTIRIGTKDFTIVGINPRAKSQPFLLKDVNGRSFKADPETIKRWLAVAGKKA